jgi:hypothetical protein
MSRILALGIGALIGVWLVKNVPFPLPEPDPPAVKEPAQPKQPKCERSR